MKNKKKHSLKVILRAIKIKIKPFLTWKFLITFGIAWCITNGWSWIFIGIGTLFDIGWMLAIGTGYQFILWQPFCVEKVITFAIAIFLHKFIFPNDTAMIEKLEKAKKKAKEQKHESKRCKSKHNTLPPNRTNNEQRIDDRLPAEREADSDSDQQSK
jgi:hypothetical protein